MQGRALNGKKAVLLVSELFPPAIGGSAVLFDGVYSRLVSPDVLVLTDRVASPGPGDERRKNMRLVRGSLASARWGILDPGAFRHHWHVASHIRSLVPRTGAVVHCGRPLPEGVAALLCRLRGGPDYVCWTHGEDIASACTSRELTFLTKWVYRRAVAAIANSRNTAEMLGALGVDARKIHVVYPSVDSQRFHPSVDGSAIRRRISSPGQVVLLSVGRLQRRKGHDHAIATVRALRADLPNLKYVIVGDGEERPRLEAQVADYGLSEQVVFVGQIGDEELPQYYAACDVFLLPNRLDGHDVEGFGIVFLEAAATGKPVIGGRSGGVPEAVEDGVTGLLVSGVDVDELAGAIRRLATTPPLRRSLGDAGRARVVSRFTWERAASAVAEIHAAVVRG